MSLVRFLVPAVGVALAGCASIDPPAQTADACAIFSEKESWWRAVKRAEDRWDVSPGYVLAVIRQESAFTHDARPPRRGGFLFFPGKRPSSAFGYAQAQDPAWQDYQKAVGDSGVDRDEFRDAADFVGWYTHESARQLGLSMSDYRAQYLAYHEGRGGYAKRSYSGKSWLLDVASKVDATARTYDAQIDRCDGRLNRMGLWPF
jgi:hypothetical protein